MRDQQFLSYFRTAIFYPIPGTWSGAATRVGQCVGSQPIAGLVSVATWMRKQALCKT